MALTETVATLFELAIAAENQMEGLYRGLTERFDYVPRVAAFWDAMADDEAVHAEALMETRDSLPQARLHSKGDPDLVRKAKELLEVIAENDLDSVSTLEDAYRQAQEFENSELNTIFVFLAGQYEPGGSRMRLMLIALEVHLERLMSFSRTLGGPAWREQIRAKAA